MTAPPDPRVPPTIERDEASVHGKSVEAPTGAARYGAGGSQRADDVAGAAEVAPSSEPLELVGRLCQTLATERIRYCHWKSNDVLDRSARGENDLDLLVAKADAGAFADVLRRLGFKEASPPPERRFPGVFHWYGLD